MSTGLVKVLILFLQLSQKIPRLFQELRNALKDSISPFIVVGMAGGTAIGAMPHPGVEFGR